MDFTPSELEKAALRFQGLSRNETGCRIWTGLKTKDGYGLICVRRKNRYAHRVAFLLSNRGFDQALDVQHTCNNPSCVAIDHLEVGPHSRNMAYMVRQGRQCKGEKHWLSGNGHLIAGDKNPWYGKDHSGKNNPMYGKGGEQGPNHKLTETQVLEIFRLRSAGWKVNDLATKFGVTRWTVSDILRGQTWKQLNRVQPLALT